MSYKPLGNRVILRIKNEDERVVGGIVLPETASNKPNEAEVIAIGEGRYRGDKLVPIPLKIGDVVVYSDYNSKDIDLDVEGDFIIVDADDILAVME